MVASNPVIIVPGITASYLRDDYPVPPETIWSVLKKNYARSTMHPDDVRYEAVEPARVQPGQVFGIAYEELIEELRFNLSESEDKPVPVFPFSYDWRQSLDSVVADLADFVEEVIDRTKLLRHYHAAGYEDSPKVNLIGHSMGGLILAGYAGQFGERGRIGKVASLASPFRGSFEAVVKVITGTANLGTSAPSSREREAARVTPALYHLIPGFGQGVEIGPGLPAGNLFSPELWQPSIVETIATYVRKFGLAGNLDDGGVPSDEEARQRAAALFEQMLSGADDYQTRINGLQLGDAGLSPADWLCVVGVGTTTRVRVRIEADDNGRPTFALRTKDREDSWKSTDPVERVNTGDGTVPFEGAVPGFLNRENLVCVTPEDYGNWELQDRALAYAAGFHGILPNMNMLHRLIVRHFTGRPDQRGNTWGRRPPGVTESEWKPAVRGLRSRD